MGGELVRDRVGHEPDPGRCAEAIRELRQRGVIVGHGGRYGNVIKLSPPLMIPEPDLDRGLATVVDVLR